MKKITMLVFLSFCAVGFSQNKSQDQNKEIKAPTGINARAAELPAAYFNNSATTVGENAGVASNGERNTNVIVPFTGTYYNNMAPNAMIYDNGPYFNVAGSPDLSVLESVTLGMGTFGAGAQFSAGNSIADDVVFADDVEISSMDVFAYQSFETAPTVTGVYVQVWDGDPSGSGASVVWGDLTTNILSDAVYADANRVLEDDQSNTDRQLNRVTANTTGLSLTAGTYWIEYTFEGSGTSGPWAPPIVILGETTTGNAIQYQSSISAWVALEDVGPQGLPFVLYGEFTGGGGNAYCIPEGTNSARFIDNFSTTGGSENISNMGSGFSDDGYGDFYDTHTVTQEQGETVEFSVDIEGGTAGFRVWVDWNQDDVFDETLEVAYMSSGYASNQTGSITVPADAMEGDTRMRIVSHWLSTTGDVDPCETGFTYGEFEDYKFTVEGTGGGNAYCIPEGTNSARFIDNFSTTGGSENISNMGSGFSDDGYGDFYDTHTVIQEQGETVEFSVDIEGGTAGFRVWVDWNQDGVFDETQEVAYMSSGYEINQTGSITVPADAMEGDTRMRVVSHWLSTTGDVDPCETGFTYGEFEDYKFTVEEGTGGGNTCDYSHGVAGDADGGAGSSLDSDYKSAVDIVVAAGEDFTMDTILVPFLTFAPEDAPTTARVVYYEDDAGLPGTEIGSETVVPTILSAEEWVNPVAYIFEAQLDITPFTFNGDAGSDTTYWVEVSMGTATNQETVFWTYTEGGGLEGEPMVQFNLADGFWSVPEPTREAIYTFLGDCSPLGVAENALVGFTYYPNPTSGSLSLKSVSNIDSVSIFNLLGQKVMDVNINATTSEINLSGLDTGTYIMQVTVEGQVGTYRVLKN